MNSLNSSDAFEVSKIGDRPKKLALQERKGKRRGDETNAAADRYIRIPEMSHGEEHTILKKLVDSGNAVNGEKETRGG